MTSALTGINKVAVQSQIVRWQVEVVDMSQKPGLSTGLSSGVASSEQSEL